jgi:dTDP-4-dehydrorhamnose 3,5-epimerase
MIDGVKITYKKQFFDERGKVMHMLRNDDSEFESFGEIYFSCTYPNTIKAWHQHRVMTLNYAVVQGQIKFVLYDDRPKSPTKGELQELYISPENYYLVTVPPLIWNGFKSVGDQSAIVANCATHPHYDGEILRLPFDDPKIPYNWDIKNK